MCQDWNQEYTECHHVSRNLVHCPTYYKQQSAATSFFGRIFNSNARHRKDCGRVIPHYGEPKPFCTKCTVKIDDLRARNVGDGALKVQRPLMDCGLRRPFGDQRKPYRRAAEESSGRLRGHVRNTSKESHEQAGNNITPTVWIPELYHQPQNLARRETYRRAAGAAPPVSSARARKLPVAKHQARRHEEEEKGRSGFPPPYPRIPPRSTSNQSQQRQPRTSRIDKPLPPTPQDPEPSTTTPVKEQPTLRRKAGHVHKICPPRRPKPSSIPVPVPLPQYQVYLNATKFAADHAASKTQQKTRLPRPPPKRKKESGLSKDEPKRSRPSKSFNPKTSKTSTLRKAIGIRPSSPESEISFVCKDSKQLSMG